VSRTTEAFARVKIDALCAKVSSGRQEESDDGIDPKISR